MESATKDEQRKQREREYNKKWRVDNRKRINEVRKKWRANNKQREADSRKAWRMANPERIRAEWARNRAAHRDERNAYCARWAKLNADKVRQKNARRRAVVRSVPIGSAIEIAEWEATWRKRRSVKCHWCNKKFPGRDCQADHVIPIAKGGAHAVENLCVACQTCNHRKHSKPPEKFNKQLRQPLLII